MSPEKQSIRSLVRSVGGASLPVLVGPAAILGLAATGAVQPMPAWLAAMASGLGGLYLSARHRRSACLIR